MLVSGDPAVRLLTAATEGPPDRTLLVIHGGPDWDHSYLRQPLTDLAGWVRFSAEWARPFVAGTLPGSLPEDAQSRLAALGLPILLLHGRQDLCFPAALAERSAAAVPGARAVILDDAGHMAHIDQPAAWLSAVAGFLAG